MEIKLAKALPCLAILLLFIFNTSEAVEKKSDDSSGKQKALYIAEILLKHPHLAEQIWNIGFTALISGVGHGNQTLDKETKKMFYNYVLDNIPRLLKNKDFENMIHDISYEFTEAYKKAKLTTSTDFSNSNDSSITHEVASEIIKHLDIGRLLKKSAKNGKPILDGIRGKDTTDIVLVANKIIDMVPSILNSTSFNEIKDIVIKEFLQGYETLMREQKGRFDGMEDNVTDFIINVLKNTNLQRLTTDILLAGKPFIDSTRGKDSTGLLMGLGYVAKAYPKILANEHFQRVKDIAMKHFGSTFLQLNLTNLDLQQNASSIIKDVISNTNKLQMVQEVLKQYSARNVLRSSVNDSVNGICYSDSIDFLDSLMTMSPWSVKMFDSIGKLSDGILDGHLNMVGSYDECNNVHAYIPKGTVLGNKTKQTDSLFNGRFCRVKMYVPQEVLEMETHGIRIYVTWGLCVPDSCQHNDVKGILSSETLKKMAPFLGNVSVYCAEDKSVSDDPSAITAIAILSIFGSIMLIGTVLELILSKRSKWHKSWYLDKFTIVQNNSKQYNETGATSGNKDMSDGTVQSCKTEKLDSKENDLPEDYVPHAENGMNGSCKDMCSELDKKKYSFYQKEVVVEKERKTCKRNDGVLIRLLTAFAIQVNTKKIVSVNAAKNAINCIHGIRFLSITWIMLGHSLNYGLVSLPGIWTIANPLRVKEMMESFTYQVVLSIPLAVDTFFMIRSIKIGLVLISVLMIGGISAAAYSEHTFKGDLLHGKGDNDVYWTNVYTPPWCRVSAYCVGILLGILMKKRPRKQLHWIQTVIGWTLATVGGLFVVYIPYSENRKGGTPWSLDVRTAYESLGRPLWASCVAWVVFACHNGNGGVVNKILSWRGLVPLSRLAYAVYLIHPIVMMTHFFSRRTLFYLDDFNVVYLYIGHIVVTFMVAFVASITFEAPFLSLEKIITGQ
ncbi:unnamed protein product [Mytilus coruscus]|uniref:Nose resistant-to-fluoxetine protein N-terminal domain-containing protein n=1 Tax=Mytilus coruscus TaxID=42192 RepID=A0A6J8DBK7_MYTCO|nr:unnamed protein product [Mytilus coruscus]